MPKPTCSVCSAARRANPSSVSLSYGERHVDAMLRIVLGRVHVVAHAPLVTEAHHVGALVPCPRPAVEAFDDPRDGPCHGRRRYAPLLRCRADAHAVRGGFQAVARGPRRTRARRADRDECGRSGAGRERDRLSGRRQAVRRGDRAQDRTRSRAPRTRATTRPCGLRRTNCSPRHDPKTARSPCSSHPWCRARASSSPVWRTTRPSAGP